MKNLILSALIILTAASCEKKSENVDTQTVTPDSITVPESNEPVESSTLQSCYMEVTGKDTLFVSLDDNLGTITGKMRYKNFEKDSSFGDVMGTQNGDTIKLNYTFEAEGTTSDREIYFLRKNGNLIEGIGEHKTEGSRDFYANPAQLKYEGHTLKSIDCTDFDKNFKSK
jgi:hypothetical protein